MTTPNPAIMEALARIEARVEKLTALLELTQAHPPGGEPWGDDESRFGRADAAKRERTSTATNNEAASTGGRNLRRAGGLAILEAGGDLYDVQCWLGHTEATTTAKWYRTIPMDRILRVVARR